MKLPGSPTRAHRASIAGLRRGLSVRRSDHHGDRLLQVLLPRTKGEPQSRLRRASAGVTQVGERIWLVTFMQYDLGYFDDETCRLEPIENPFGPKVLPMSPE